MAGCHKGARGLCGLFPHPCKKNILQKEEEKEKTERINTMKTNSKRRKDLRIATWIIQTLYRTGGLRITINELREYKITIAGIQGTRWTKSTPQAFSSIGYNI
jgi:hypothetical protein